MAPAVPRKVAKWPPMFRWIVFTVLVTTCPLGLRWFALSLGEHIIAFSELLLGGELFLVTFAISAEAMADEFFKQKAPVTTVREVAGAIGCFFGAVISAVGYGRVAPEGIGAKLANTNQEMVVWASLFIFSVTVISAGIVKWMANK
jgi:hypothetical protein